MSDRENRDHLGLLASNLGIDTPKDNAAPLPLEDANATGEKEISREVAEETPAPPIVASEPEAEKTPVLEAKTRVSPPPRPRRTADWTQLASSFGIVPPEEPVTVAPPPVEAEAVAEPVRPEPAERPGEEAPVPSEEIAEGWTESVIELMEESDEAPDALSEPPEARPEPESMRPDRRRRKRRRRSRRPAEGETGAERGEGSRDRFASESEESPSQPEADLLDLPGQAETGRPPATGEPQAERPKRRRRRRGDRRRERELPARQDDAVAETEYTTSPGDSEVEPPLPPGEDEEASLAEPDDLADEQEEDLDDIDKADKDGHRAIPSWEEAISHIVSKNLEARARKPDSGSSRPRGGRGRGRD